MAAGAFGTSDFAAGLASRRLAPAAVTCGVEVITLITVAATLLVSHGDGPSATALGWGAISGLGTALGTLSLYHGLSVARMSVVATLSAVLTAVIPVIVGVALGEHLTPLVRTRHRDRDPGDRAGLPAGRRRRRSWRPRTAPAPGCSTDHLPASGSRSCSSRSTAPERMPGPGPCCPARSSR